MKFQASEALSFLQTSLDDHLFLRGDYKYLVQLSTAWLGGSVTNFKFHIPMACHHPRFMGKAISYLTLDLLLPQFQTLAPDLVSAMEAVLLDKWVSSFQYSIQPGLLKPPWQVLLHLRIYKPLMI